MTRIAGRYEIKAKLGEGGMGVVFRAYDPPPMDREVAVKTLHEFSDPFARELFYKECAALKSFSHPNVVEIFDLGEYEEGGHQRPFFVMPLLPGQTLDELIRKASHRLTVDRVVEIFAQTCRGLQAAHERGLVHRDLKPSNIFVMADDSVKIIDFGVAHAAQDKSRSGYDKGTLLYMAPEQVQHKPVSVQSDIYSIGVTLYEALTRRQPFRHSTEDSVVRAILNHIPPPASDLNPAVSHVISRVVHKAIAKQAWNRFDSARELGDTLQKAYRNEPIALFDPARSRPRILTATKALEKGDYQFAGEIVSELEAEGNIDPQITILRAQIDQIARQKTVAQLLESARARFEEEEDPLALQKLQEVLQLDPTNVGALSLKGRIEDRRSDRQIEKWIQLAQQHAANRSYSHAREALKNALGLRPKDSRAARLLKEVETEEADYVRLRREKTELYQAAVNAWQNGEVSQALSQMKLVLDLDRRAPDASSPDAAGMYQAFYDKIRSEHDAMNTGYAEARRLLADKEFARALAICETFLAKYPGQALFQALKFDVEEQQRQRLSAFIADVDRRLEAEADLDAKLSLVREAAAQFPEENHFRRLAKLLQDKRDLVNSIVERARVHESSGQIAEAISDLETLRTIYAAYPGLDFEKQRLRKRLEQHTRDTARARWVRQIDGQLHAGDHARAVDLLDKADVEFPADPELAELRKLALQGLERSTRADELAAEGQRLCEQGQFEHGVEQLRAALRLDDRNGIRLTLRDVLVGRAQELFETDWRTADRIVDQALEIDPGHPLAKSLRSRALDKRRDETVPRSASLARRLQAEGRIEEAMAEVEKGLAAYPDDSRLAVIADALRKQLARTAAPPPLPPAPPEPGPELPTRITPPTPRPAPQPALEERTVVISRDEPTATVRPPSRSPREPKPEPVPEHRLFLKTELQTSRSGYARWASIGAMSIVVAGIAWMWFFRGPGDVGPEQPPSAAMTPTPADPRPTALPPRPPVNSPTPTAKPTPTATLTPTPTATARPQPAATPNPTSRPPPRPTPTLSSGTTLTPTPTTIASPAPAATSSPAPAAGSVAVKFRADRDDVTVTFSRPDGSTARSNTNPMTPEVFLLPGRLDVETVGPAGIPYRQTVTIAGRFSDVQFARGWETMSSADWRQTGDKRFTSTGNGAALTISPIAGGTISFIVPVVGARASGNPYSEGSRLSWVIGHVDDRNYTAFEIEGRDFVVRQVTNGRERSQRTRNVIPGVEDADTALFVQVQLSAKGVVHSYRLIGKGRPAGLQPLVTEVPIVSTHGRVGFLPGGAGRLTLLDFRYYPPSR